MASEPYEIILAPFEVYIAPVGESFPAIDAEPPGGNWTLIGTNGNVNYGEDGVTVQHGESVEDIRMLGATGPVKAARTEESLVVSFNLHDISFEHYKYALNLNTVTDNAAATPPDKEINTYKGHDVATRALLVRGVSPYGDGWNLQYEVPRVRPGGEPEVTYAKGEPAGLSLEFNALIDLNAASDAERFGRIRAQSAA